MAYDHGNSNYSYGNLPKTHYREAWINVPNSCAMIPIVRPKDRHGYDRSKFTPKLKMQPYVKGKPGRSNDRKHNISTAMRKHYRSAMKTSKRFRLKQEMWELLNELDCQLLHYKSQ